MGASNILGDVGRKGLPLLPTASSRHLETGNEVALHIVETHLDLTTTQTCGHTCRELLGNVTVELHVLEFDEVAIVNLSHINANLIVLLCLHAL